MLRRIVVFVMFAAMLATGACVFRDYGYPTDDGTEHYGSLVAAKRISAAFGAHPARLDKVKDIDQYRDRYYGTAVQMVPTFVELALGLEGSREILLVRHAWTFLVYFISLACFHLLCLRLFRSPAYAATGTLMLFLYPRFFAQSFYNIKDIGFSALLTIALYACVVFLQGGRRTGHATVAAFLTALAANSRFYALVLFAGTLFMMAIEDAGVHEAPRRSARSYVAFAVAFAVSFIVLTPASWSNPLAFPFAYVAHFVGFEGWNGSLVFAGELFRKEAMPRYYVATWYAISVPLAYISFFFLGAFVLARKSTSPAGIKPGSSDAILCFIAVLFFIAIAATFVRQGLLYIEWRHLYFTFPLFVLIAVSGLEWAMKQATRPVPQLALAAIVLSLASQLLWIVRNHPYEYAYLNVAGRPFGAQFDRDYWGLCQKQLLEWLAGHVEAEPIRVAYVAAQAGSLLIFPDELQHRFSVVDTASADFVVTSFQRSTLDDLHIAGFEEIHSIRLDGYKLGAVYKARSVVAPEAPTAATANR